MQTKNHKIIVCCPAGRKQTLEILFSYVLKQRSFVDEFRLWVNTNNEADLEYINFLAKTYSDFITLDFSAQGNPSIGRSMAVCTFYPNCTEQDTVYFKIDDDVVWIEDNFFQKMYEFRIKNREYFLIFANTVNNACNDYIHQRMGLLRDIPLIYYHCGDPVAWGENEYCIIKHRHLINAIKNKDFDKYKFSRWIELNHQQISINCICWMGEDFADFGGKVSNEDELFLSTTYPQRINRFNCINGNALCSHFAFGRQIQIMLNSGILEEYKQLAGI